MRRGSSRIRPHEAAHRSRSRGPLRESARRARGAPRGSGTCRPHPRARSGDRSRARASDVGTRASRLWIALRRLLMDRRFWTCVLVLAAACSSPDRSNVPPNEATPERPLEERAQLNMPWTDAFQKPAVLIANEVRIEGPRGLLQHVATMSDPSELDRKEETRPEGFLQEIVVRPAAVVAVAITAAVLCNAGVRRRLGRGRHRRRRRGGRRRGRRRRGRGRRGRRR